MSISVDKAVIARIVKGGEKFEILVDPIKALEVKMGKEVSLDDLLASNEIYEDSKKGLRAAGDKINKAFGSNDLKIISKKIIKDGDVQLTTEQRNQMIEENRKKIASIISRRGVNPQTGLPHPVDRVARAMEQTRIKVVLEKSAEEQVDAMLKAIQPIIPIRFEKLQIGIKVPPEFASRASGIVRNLGSVIREEWKSDGSYICALEIPAGMQQDVYDKINNLTHGKNEIKIIKRETI